ncbi:hypothetical protein [Flavobacterium lindanitolerans]|uniref:hypothetical protein n=1 Tax=Flavobacterium lindanitolerans TaxID=428988 RepID=UPI0031AC1D79
MKKYIFIAYLFLIGINAFAQNPEFSGRPYLWQDKKLTDLERVDAQFDTKAKGLGYGGVDTYYTVFTGKSDIRFSKEKLPIFVVKVDKGIDPAEVYSVLKAKVKKNKRSFLIGSYAMGGKAKDTGKEKIKITYKKLKDGIYEISLPSDIAAGEYSFVPNSTEGMSAGNKMKITCFGID